MHKVSVIIPTYNRAHLIERAIRSVLSQTFEDFEVIVVDDASIDNTAKLVKNFTDGRIKYLRHVKNKGGSAARNTGIANVSSEYIAFLDSDDEWLPEKLEKQMELFNHTKKNLGVVYTAYRKIGWKIQPDLPQYRENISDIILARNVVGTTSTVLIKKECFTKVGVFDQTLPSCQDWDMWIRIAQHYTFDFINEILVRYYHQTISISMNSKASINGHKRIAKKYKQQIKTIPKNFQAEHYFYLGVNFWWKKSILSLIYFVRSIFISYSIVPRIVDFVILRNIKKIVIKKGF